MRTAVSLGYLYTMDDMLSIEPLNDVRVRVVMEYGP